MSDDERAGRISTGLREPIASCRDPLQRPPCRVGAAAARPAFEGPRDGDEGDRPRTRNRSFERDLLLSSWRCYAALGDDYGRVGDKQQALDALTPAERLAPADAVVQFELGLAYAALGQDQQAAAALEKTLALGASHANVLYNLGVVYARLANYDAAWLHARIAEHQGYPAADLISRLAQLAPEPIW